MDDLTNKEKRIKFLEETVRWLLKEKAEWESRACKLENKLRAKEISGEIFKEDLNKDHDFLNQVGGLIRPLIHEIKGQLSFLESVIRKTINYFETIKPGKDLIKIKELLNSSTIAIEHLRRRITDLSYLGGKVPDVFTRVEVNELIKENTKFIRNRHENIDIELNLHNGSMEILADEESLNQIITNLTINAIEACEPSRGHIIVATKKIGDGRFIQIIVKDNGIGIYPDEINKIYDLHYTTKKIGFGIGLYLVKKAVDLHKGKIKCESIPNSGTTFTVTLPISQEDRDDPS
ncbi:MAG: ATP-binding protein [Nitrospirota bacterium]